MSTGDENQKSVPPAAGAGEYVREVPEHPVVRDSEDNPVVRTRDLEAAIAPLDTRQKVGFAVIGAIGVANLLGIRADINTAKDGIKAGVTLIAKAIAQHL